MGSNTRVKKWVVLVAVAGALSCTAGEQRRVSGPASESAAAEEVAPSQPPAVVGAPECLDANDRPAECLQDSDCCPGFVCGKDPELSRRVTFCIYAG